MTERIERTQDLYLIDMTGSSLPAEEGQIRFLNNDIWGFVNGSVVSLTAGGSGITESQHEGLDTLVHEIDENSYDEVTYTGSDVTSYIVWTSAAKTRKIREEQYTYGTGHRVSQCVTTQYDGTGAVKMTMTETYTYVNSRVNTVTRVKTGSP